ncbi:hypothetical protein TNCV_3567481 [Trichonephila clavipes]|nr:hypothetical protein TNCV_3567481 [Trichonephila clavipes]
MSAGSVNAYGFQSRVNKATNMLQTFHSAANGIKWYERTSIDAISLVCRFFLQPVMTDTHHRSSVSSNTLISLKDRIQKFDENMLDVFPKVCVNSLHTKKKHEKTIAVLEIANLLSTYIVLAGGATVHCDVRLHYNANDFVVFECTSI